MARSMSDIARERAAKKAAKQAVRQPRQSRQTKQPKETKTELVPASAKTTTPAQAKTSTTQASISTDIAGLSSLLPQEISELLPTFDESKYRISDPLNPPEMPQISEARHSELKGIYEGAGRALDVTGMAFDVAAKGFNVIGKRAKSFSAGIQAATAVEKTKGDFLDYQNQKETTSQKQITLENSQARTVNDRAISVHTQTINNEKLKQAEIDAESAKQKTQQAQNELLALEKKIGQIVTAK